MRCLFVILTLCLVVNNLLAFGDDPKRAARPLVNWGSLDGALGDNGLPAGWTTYPPGFAQYDSFTVTDVWHSAPRGLRLSAKAPWASVIAAQHAVEAGTRQAARVWVRRSPDSPGESLLRIDYLNASGNTMGSSPAVTLRSSAAPGGSEWKLLTVEGTSAAFPGAKRFQLVAAQKGGGAAVWDDFDLRQYTDSGEPNLLSNGDFELAAGDEFPGWRLFTTEAVDARLSPILKDPYRGWLAAGIAGEARSAVLSTSRLPIDSSRTYRLSGWHRGASEGGRFKLVFWKDGKHVASVKSTAPAGADWTASGDVAGPPAVSQGATHVTVEYEVTGKFDAAVDAVRFWSE